MPRLVCRCWRSVFWGGNAPAARASSLTSPVGQAEMLEVMRTLKAILFFGGIMNLYWIAGLAVLILLEKILPFGARLSYATGPLLIIWGLWFWAVPLLH